jgi:hypothetical protein
MKTMITGFVLFILVATGLTQEKPVSWPVDSAEVVLPPIVITKTDSVLQDQNTNADLAQAVQKECKTTENNKESK